MSQFKPPNLFPQDTHSALSNSFLDVPMGDATSDDDSGSETFTDALEAQSVMTAISQDLPLGLGPPASQHERVPSESSPSQVNLAIPGLYLIFDLISENGTGGMVDKIIIAQDSLAAFVNDLCPGAYTSITKVDFKALDQNIIRPVGVYGNKVMITHFLCDNGIIDHQTLLRLVSSNEQQAPSLRSGLYVARAPHTPQDVFVIYWPEDGTWSSQAQSSVRRNRVTFMRYLAKLTEQLICLISSEDQASIVWSTGGDQTTNDDEDPDETDDRLFSFEVAKTREEEENVTVRPGFDIRCRSVMPPQLEASCKVDPLLLAPRLICGETSQAILIGRFRSAGIQANRPNNARYERALLRDLLERGQLRISEDVDDLAIDFMIKSGLDKRCPAEIKQYKDDKAEIENTVHSQKVQELHTWTRTQEEEECRLRLVMKKEILRRIVALYPVVRDELTKQHPEIVFDEDDTTYQNMATSYPVLRDELDASTSPRKLSFLGGRFALLKERVMIADHLLRAINFSGKQAERDHLIKSALRGDSLITSSQSKTSRSSSRFTLNFSLLWNSDIDRDDRHRTKVIEEAKHAANAKSDCEFFTELPIFGEREPLFKETIEKLQISLMEQLNNLVDKTPSSAARKLSRTQTDGAKKHLDLKYSQLLNNRLRDNRRTFFVAVEQKTDSDNGVLCVIDDLRPERVYYSSYSSACNVTGQIITKTQETMEFKIIPLKISSADMQELSVNPSFIPHPEEVAFRLQTSFELTTNCRINFIQMVHDDRCLVIVDDGEKLFVYLDKLGSLGRTITSRKSHRQLYKEKLGAQPLITFDESKRLLAFCIQQPPALHLYVFSEDFSALTSWSGVIPLHTWYSDGASIVLATFIACSEEILLVDDQKNCRIFSLVSRQFRPGSVLLSNMPSAVYSSPDGHCLFLSFPGHNGLQAFHCATFGSSSSGLFVLTDSVPSGSLQLTSIGPRSNAHFVGLDVLTQRCASVVLDITTKSTEFQFLSKDSRRQNRDESSARNPFLDCFAETWRRFPVVPAIPRQTTLHGQPQARQICFVTEHDHSRYEPYFQEMHRGFELQTRKPTGVTISSTQIRALTMEMFTATFGTWLLSEQRAGEWLVDMFCLLPIHIAITQENRFVPLKDGVISRELEQSLLGADVGRVVDSISFGWYESIFRSYHASKPVKVVSSMGEQSVGKSFALNHLADTSFAGSAMRTTEGVWMSVTPTEDLLLVALDFEGVHSLERSAQEDMLLVLFNTAISNLVMFRNNFALSRDIAGLFQSFQSSTNVLDPASNPNLFQSRLAIIIKDVVDGDTDEIVKEFRLKFHRIVAEEQDANFISKLHAGQLDIIPWPVIESRKFYTLFGSIKKRLDRQPVTHRSAGEFLQVIKTLMAKLKTNDWGAMSHTMASHRAQRLLEILPNAMSHGFAEIDPEFEHLKNFDHDTVIPSQDNNVTFVFGQDSIDSRNRVLQRLFGLWEGFSLRSSRLEAEWIQHLSGYLSGLADDRIQHVRDWIDANTERFKDGQQHAAIDEVYRHFESLAMELKVNVDLCKLQCEMCSLKCLKHRSHEVSDSHDCGTSHFCQHWCEFEEEHVDGAVRCGYPAGHAGKHTCEVNRHMCGEPCGLSSRKGCLIHCTNVANHPADEGHFCSARIHSCGEPCTLVNVLGTGDQRFTCRGSCILPSDQQHDQHQCELPGCPMRCVLCSRLCDSTDHLHALDDGAVHLCGQTHSCPSLCAARGICEIDTAPQSIEATFTGRNETFQYTKYSQVAKRSKCAILIPEGETSHAGAHSHSLEADPFHFCETQCSYCNYYCTLPLGHTQREHDTRHGSMSRTVWSVEGPDTNVMEVDGRKFSGQDDGAPMLCSLVCSSLGRHIHIDVCQSENTTACGDADVRHIAARMLPDPDIAKDFITHALYWRRCGFKDPYSKDEQTTWAKCDCYCPGTEHEGNENDPPQHSYCTLPMFHPPAQDSQAPPMGYVSRDGHAFACKNPTVMQLAFHVVFVVDRSGSMADRDRRPLQGTPVTAEITRVADNRLGAVYSSLFAFWSSRSAAINASGAPAQARRDAYSVVFFDSGVSRSITNDFTSTPEELLQSLLQYTPRGWTNYNLAIQETTRVVRENWSTERSPVVVFLSDGECDVDDQHVVELGRACVALGKPLSFHTVAFGPSNAVLRRMAQLALDVQNSAPPDQTLQGGQNIPSSYTEALDSICLAQTFLGFAESLRKARGALVVH